jgi:hypothetical protein
VRSGLVLVSGPGHSGYGYQNIKAMLVPDNYPGFTKIWTRLRTTTASTLWLRVHRGIRSVEIVYNHICSNLIERNVVPAVRNRKSDQAVGIELFDLMTKGRFFSAFKCILP